MAGQRLRVMTGRRDDIALGDKIAVAIPETAMHLFDRESGERLSASG